MKNLLKNLERPPILNDCRRFRRVKVDFPVAYERGAYSEQNCAGERTDPIRGRAVNLSEGGLAIFLPSKLTIGEKSRVKLTPLEWEQAICANSVVVWQQKHIYARFGQQGPHQSLLTGVKFVDLQPSLYRSIRAFLLMRRHMFRLTRGADGDQETLAYWINRGTELPGDRILKQEFLRSIQEIWQLLELAEQYCKAFDKNKLEKAKRITFINEMGDGIFPSLDQAFFQLWKCVEQLPKLEYKVYQRYLQDTLGPWLLAAKINRHIYVKPFGYAGDYVVMNFLYADEYEGDSSYSKLLHRYTLHLPAARAHINRRLYFRHKILEATGRAKGNVIRIASIPCGPAVEIIDLLRRGELPRGTKFLGIDFESRVLKQIWENVRELDYRQRGIEIELSHKNILEFLHDNAHFPELENQNFIYCSGFLDYLSNRMAARVISYLFDQLAPGGELICVNISKDNPSRAVLEMLGEWELHHRNAETLIGLTRDLGKSADVRVEFEPETKMNIFLIIKKSGGLHGWSG